MLLELDVTELVVLVTVTEDAEDVVVLEADVVEFGVAGANAEDAAYDARTMTTTTATMITVVFLLMAVLKIRGLAILQL